MGAGAVKGNKGDEYLYLWVQGLLKVIKETSTYTYGCRGC